MQQELQSNPGLLPLIRNREVREFLESPDSYASINRTLFLGQLDVVDNAACSWLALVGGIDVVNVFQGFSSEAELVDYFLNQAYADGVVVLASTSIIIILLKIGLHFKISVEIIKVFKIWVVILLK